MQNKRGQEILGMSFGTMISIFLIIIIIAVGFFVIRHFLSLNNCTQMGMFFEDLQDETDRAWTSGRYVDTFEGKLPQSGIFKTGLTHVCFGTVSAAVTNTEDESIRDEIYSSYRGEANLFLHPKESACDGSLATYTLKHAAPSSFFCIEILKGIAAFKLEKNERDSLVKISETQ